MSEAEADGESVMPGRSQRKAEIGTFSDVRPHCEATSKIWQMYVNMSRTDKSKVVKEPGI